jgi:hypothetical protein
LDQSVGLKLWNKKWLLALLLYRNTRNQIAVSMKFYVILKIFFTANFTQVIVADNYFTGSKDNLKKWIGHPRFELIRHGILSLIYFCMLSGEQPTSKYVLVTKY